MKRFVGALGIGILSFAASACSSSTPTGPSAVAVSTGENGAADAGAAPTAAPKPGDKTIVEIVLQDDGEFDVLQAAVVRAGLVDALNGTTQYTVFAPTDRAFVSTLGVANEAAALAAVGGLPVDSLTNILLFHVTNGRRNSTSVLAAPRYQMLNGGTLTRTKLTAAGFSATDISASNGIIHVINAVLMP